MAAAALWKLLTALWTVYLVWGSTYLAIKLSVRTLPAFLSAKVALLAGALLALILTATGRSITSAGGSWRPRRCWGSRCSRSVSGWSRSPDPLGLDVAAMIAGSVPLQVILLRTIARDRVAVATRLSVLVGLVGRGADRRPRRRRRLERSGLAFALSASISWSLGSFFAHRLPLPRDSYVATTWEMLSAGVILLVLGVAAGEPWSMDPAGFTLESVGLALASSAR